VANARILSGSVFDMLPTIEPGSVDCAVTSPPYWMLRSYLPKDHPLKALELGQEPTPQEYIANVVKWCGLVRDCLAEHGTLWLNVGDTYNQYNGNRGASASLSARIEGAIPDLPRGDGKTVANLAAGQLCLIPQRLAIALQDDGWIVRSYIVWRKPSCMPDSITGWQWKRCKVKTKSQPKATRNKAASCESLPYSRDYSGGIINAEKAEYEDCPGCKKCSPNDGFILRRGSWRPTSSWEPIIMLAKSADYFCDGETTKTPPANSTVSRDKYTRILDDTDEQFAVAHDHETTCQDGAKLRDVWAEDLEKLTKEQLIALMLESMDAGDCWTIPFEPLKASHYAAYPSELVHRCLSAGVSSEGYCYNCSAPFVRVVESEKTFQSGSGKSGNAIAGKQDLGATATNSTPDIRMGPVTASRTLGWRPSCRCPNAKPRPGKVLDPFCGSGRTAIAAMRLGFDFVGVELNEDFVAMGKKLISQDAPLFNDVDAA
jgi:DNA modification methylase